MRGDDYLRQQGDSKRRGRMPGGLLSVVAVAACIAGLLVWTMAAHDPYWRLFEPSSVPAPGYETPEEIEAALASVAVGAPSADSAAVRPDSATEAPGPVVADDPVVAMLPPRSADAVIAVPAALVRGADPVTAALARAPAWEAPGSPDATVLRASAPAPLAHPAPVVRPDAAATLAVAALDPVDVPGTPGPLRIRADEASEQALALSRAERVRVQRRLALAGFDPSGFDGLFGQRTREAIADFQTASGFPSTGYLDVSVLADLRARTEEAYAAVVARAGRGRAAAPKHAPIASARQVARSDDAGGCARDAAGRIIERQSFGCDVKGLAEKVVSLGRDKLSHEEDDALTVDGALAFGPGAER